jgi:hypothetical protein
VTADDTTTTADDEGQEDADEVFTRPEDEAGKKALAAERKARRDAEKQLSELQSRLQEIEDKDKSELERLTERLGAAERRALDADRLEIALEKGLTKGQAKRLVGTTREELETDADDLLSDLAVGDEKPAPTPSRQPQERLRPGAAPDVEPEETDPAKLAAAVQRAKYGLS